MTTAHAEATMPLISSFCGALMPRRQTRFVQAWIELRRDELLADWSLAVKGQPVFPIDPLK